MIRIGIVGCGRILAAHLRGYRLLRAAGVDDFRITALCSRRKEDASMYLRRGGQPPQRPAVSNIPGDPLAIGDEYLSDFQDDVEAEVYDDYRQMIASGKIDAVNDFSIHSLHHQVAEAAFAAGKHLLSQKPLAITVAAGRRMCEEAEARGLTFGVFENFRQSSETRRLRWLFGQEDRPAGRLQMILLGYVGVWWAPDRIVAETPWRHVKREGGGISLDLGVHFFDQIRSVAGEIRTVTGSTTILEPRRHMRDHTGASVSSIDCDADDTFMAQSVTERGVVANLTSSWGGHGGPTICGSGTVFYGSKGRVTGDEAWLDGGRLRKHLAELYLEGTTPPQRRADFPLGLDESFALNQHDWLEAIRHRREPETSGREGLADLAAAYAILESAAAKRTVELKEVLSGSLRGYQEPIDRYWKISV